MRNLVLCILLIFIVFRSFFFFFWYITLLSPCFSILYSSSIYIYFKSSVINLFSRYLEYEVTLISVYFQNFARFH